MAFAVGLLDGRVVGVLVRNEESGLDVAAVRVLALAVEDLLVEIDVVVVDRVVEGDGDHHGDVFGGQTAGNGGAILRAEAVGQHADGGIARWRPVGVIVDICVRVFERGGRKEGNGVKTSDSCGQDPLSRDKNITFN